MLNEGSDERIPRLPHHGITVKELLARLKAGEIFLKPGLYSFIGEPGVSQAKDRDEMGEQDDSPLVQPKQIEQWLIANPDLSSRRKIS